MYISYHDLPMYAYSSDKLIEGDALGIILDFTGLGGTAMFREDPDWVWEFAEKRIIILHPYINPWAWMNHAAVNLTDACIEAIFEKNDLPDTMPIISQGGSMGGLCALTYSVYAKRTPAGVAANCPVCNLPYHYTERPDLPRTLVSAFGDYPLPLQDAMETASPYHLAQRGRFHDIPYYIVHCENDMSVNKEKHSDRLVDLLGRERTVYYHSVPGRGHCDLTPEARKEYNDFMIQTCMEQWV